MPVWFEAFLWPALVAIGGIIGWYIKKRTEADLQRRHNELAAQIKRQQADHEARLSERHDRREHDQSTANRLIEQQAATLDKLIDYIIGISNIKINEIRMAIEAGVEETKRHVTDDVVTDVKYLRENSKVMTGFIDLLNRNISELVEYKRKMENLINED